MLRGGDYACLVERSSQTARRSNEAQLRTRDLPESKQHRKTRTTLQHMAIVQCIQEKMMI